MSAARIWTKARTTKTLAWFGEIAIQHYSVAANKKDLLLDSINMIDAGLFKVTICDLKLRKTWHAPPPLVAHNHRFRSSVRYCTASDRCFGARSSVPSRSAIVRATFKMRS